VSGLQLAMLVALAVGAVVIGLFLLSHHDD